MRIYNFSPGPATLPIAVLERIQKEFTNYNLLGYSLIEASHRSKTFENMLNACQEKLKRHMNLDDSYEVLFLHGGASTAFYQIPMNFLQGTSKKAYYIDTGIWTTKAIKEAKHLGDVEVLATSADKNYCCLPYQNQISELALGNNEVNAAYLYLCSNNTIFGTQWSEYPTTTTTPIVGDFSSDILSRQVDYNKFKIIFAGLQKNLGPAGAAVVVIEKNFLQTANDHLPSMCSYKVIAKHNSVFNTPPMFCIYFLGYMLDWIEEQGGMEVIEKNNRTKAEMLYNAIDDLTFYSNPVNKRDRSIMNITFNLHDEKKHFTNFVQAAEAEGMVGLKGHRLIGGFRASIYNALSIEGVEKLVDFLKSFAKKYG